jgi:hypothetical protein
MFLGFTAPALGFCGTGFSFGLLRLVVLPPSPSPFFKMAVPVAAIETSYLSIGLMAVTPAALFFMYSTGKSPKAEC